MYLPLELKLKNRLILKVIKPLYNVLKVNNY